MFRRRDSGETCISRPDVELSLNAFRLLMLPDIMCFYRRGLEELTGTPCMCLHEQQTQELAHSVCVTRLEPRLPFD